MANKTMKATVTAYNIMSAPRASSVQLSVKDKEGKITDTVVISSLDEAFINGLKDKKTISITIE